MLTCYKHFCNAMRRSEPRPGYGYPLGRERLPPTHDSNAPDPEGTPIAALIGVLPRPSLYGPVMHLLSSPLWVKEASILSRSSCAPAPPHSHRVQLHGSSGPCRMPAGRSCPTLR